MSGFDWRALMQAGLVHGLRPDAFWRLTPAEFAVVIGREGGVVPLTRAGLSDLVQAFPDRTEDDPHG